VADKKFVIARDNADYRHWLRENNLRDRVDAFFIDNAHRFAGYEITPEQLISTELAIQRRDYQYQLEFMQSRIRLKEVTE
jgi:hypothetical protein